jgi:hypothetical protein
LEAVDKMKQIIYYTKPKIYNVLYECPHEHPHKHKHHFDYSRPYDVYLLCSRCHIAVHAIMQPKDGKEAADLLYFLPPADPHYDKRYSWLKTENQE